MRTGVQCNLLSDVILCSFKLTGKMNLVSLEGICLFARRLKCVESKSWILVKHQTIQISVLRLEPVSSEIYDPCEIRDHVGVKFMTLVKFMT